MGLFQTYRGLKKRTWDKQNSCTFWRFHANVCTPHIAPWSLEPQFRWKQHTFIPCCFHHFSTLLFWSSLLQKCSIYTMCKAQALVPSSYLALTVSYSFKSHRFGLCAQHWYQWAACFFYIMKLDPDTSLDDNQEILYLHFHQLFLWCFLINCKVKHLTMCCLLKI